MTQMEQIVLAQAARLEGEIAAHDWLKVVLRITRSELNRYKSLFGEQMAGIKKQESDATEARMAARHQEVFGDCP